MTELILPYLPTNPSHILEPSVGAGAIHNLLKEKYPNTPTTVVDIRNTEHIQMEHGIHYDFLHWKAPRTYDLIITNPPFNKKLEFAKRCPELTSTLGHLYLLLPLHFLSSMGRRPWLQNNTPDLYVLPRRPSFTGTTTANLEYAWFHWTKNNGSKGMVKIL